MREQAPDEKKTHPWEDAPDGGGSSFGGWLRQHREIRGISLREIAESSKISIRYLEALETSRFSILPAPVFAKGFLRQYASLVGLDPDEVVNFYIVAQKDSPIDSDPLPQGSRLHSATHWAYGFFLTFGIVALFGVVALLSFLAERRQPSGEAPPPMAAPVFSNSVVPETLEAEAPLMPLVVTLDFVQDCWVEAEVDGTSSVAELFVQGESVRLEAQRSISLTLGNPGGVSIQVNGEDYALPPETGETLSGHMILAPVVVPDEVALDDPTGDVGAEVPAVEGGTTAGSAGAPVQGPASPPVPQP